MIDPISTLKIALAHDWLVGMRGGEFVLDRLAQLLGPCDLYTMVTNHRPLTPAIDACRVIPSPLQKLPGASGALRRWYLPLYPWAVEHLNVEPCDLLISTSSAAIKSIRPPHGTPHLCYCHSPARYIWEQTEDYTMGRGGRLRALGLNAFRKRFQEWDRRTASRVTQFLTNSTHVARRIERCYGREAIVVPPPVRTEFFTPDPSVRREDFFLVVAAHEPYKRTDLVINAANQAQLPLKIAGTGSQFESLKSLAGPTVEMLGRVSDNDLRDLYRRARALIQVQVEDFGITAVEAQACGCPVIALRRGGALDTVTESTGVFFDEQSADALLSAIDEFKQRSVDPHACRAHAEQFNEARFDAAIEREITRLLEQCA